MSKSKQTDETEDTELFDDEFLGLLDKCEDIPVNPKDPQADKYGKSGWQYYLKVRPLLPEWWEEFNSKILSSGKLAYGSVLQFVKAKTRSKTDRQYLYWMIGPKPSSEVKTTNGKYEVPWLGDWGKRRKNGYWTEDNHLPIQQLKKALKANKQAADTVKASAPFLIQDLMRINKRIGQLDDLFGGNPFVVAESPNSKGNITRFKTYITMYKMLWKQKIAIVHEIMRIMGINPQRPNEMWGMTQLAGVAGQIGASAALTGAAASGGMVLPGSPGGPQLQISSDAMYLAAHLSQHSKDFDLPYKIDGKDITELVNTEVSNEKKEKRNGKAHVV